MIVCVPYGIWNFEMLRDFYLCLFFVFNCLFELAATSKSLLKNEKKEKRTESKVLLLLKLK